MGHPDQVVALDREGHRTREIDDERRGSVLEGGLSREPGGDRDRPGLGVPGLQGLEPAEREQSLAPVLPLDAA